MKDIICKESIIYHNKMYREGSPSISDKEYDSLLEEYSTLVSKKEFEDFIKTLNEGKGKVKHTFIVGSLKKIRIDKEKEVNSISDWKFGYLTPKLDGCAVVVYYNEGKLYKAVTRGDGYFGQDVTDRMKLILPKEIYNKNIKFVRGELLMNQKSFEEICEYDKNNYKNSRNLTSAMLNKNDVHPCFKKLDFIIYSIDNENIYETCLLNEEFEMVPWVNVNEFASVEEACIKTYNKFLTKIEYPLDGVVLTKTGGTNFENDYYQDDIKAVKFNDGGSETKVVDIEWNVSKNGAIKPVVIISPIELCGTTVKRVSGFNIDYVRNNGIYEGATISLIKSGDIIPFITEVIDKKDFQMFESCPSCGGEIYKKSVDVYCKDNCGSRKQISFFVQKMGVDNVSEKQLKKFNINSFQDLIDFYYNNKDKDNSLSYTKFIEQIESKILKSNKKKLFSYLPWDGISEKIWNKIFSMIEFEDLDNFDSLREKLLEVDGIGEIILDKIKISLPDNLNLLKLFDVGMFTEEIKESNGATICITGTLSKPRKYFEEMATERGFKVSNSVTKNLDYLLVGNDAGSKLEKAKKMGVSIITEYQFMEEM